MNISFRQLRAFVTVARSGSVSQASLQLSLTQSSVSMALKELEAQLGVQLFDRAGKRLQMNAQGHRLLARAQSILDQVEGIAEVLGKPMHHQLAIGASTTIADCLYPTLAGHLYARYPGIELLLETGNSSTILAQLLARRIDIGLVEGICQHPQVTSKPWWTDQLAIVASPTHSLAGLAAKGALPVRALAGSQWIMREAGSGTRAIFEHAFRTYIAGFSVRAELKHVPTIKALVAAGDALACLSSISVSDDLASGRLVELAIDGIELSRQFYLLEHRQGYRSQVHGHLIDWIGAQASAMHGKLC